MLVGLFADLFTKAWVIVRLGLPIRQLDPDLPAMQQIAPLYQWAVQRFGDSTDGKEVQYLLLTRPFRSATRFGVTVMAELAADSKEALLSCFAARYAGVRKAATDRLLALIDQSDLPRLLELTRVGDRDVKR